MTSRRPNNATLASSSSSYSSTRASSNPPAHANHRLAPVIPREDTPISKRGSTPRSYQSIEVDATSSTASQDPNPNYGTYSHQPQAQAGAQAQTHTQTQQPQQDGRTGSIGSEIDTMDTRHTSPWYKKAAEKYGSLELENKGSVARDHLALERTFLAWLRTSLAFASIGIAITQLFRLNTSLSPDPDSSQSGSFHPSAPILPPRDSNSDSASTAAAADDNSYERIRSLGKPLGATFIGIAIVVLFIGFHRYFESQYWVVRGKFPASRGSIAIVSFFTGALMIGSLVVILTMNPGAVEA